MGKGRRRRDFTTLSSNESRIPFFEFIRSCSKREQKTRENWNVINNTRISGDLNAELDTNKHDTIRSDSCRVAAILAYSVDASHDKGEKRLDRKRRESAIGRKERTPLS